MNTSSPIAVATDGSPVAVQAVRWAATEAAMRGLPLHLIHVVDYSPFYFPGLDSFTADATFDREALNMLEVCANIARNAAGQIGPIKTTTELVHGSVTSTLIAETKNVSQMVLGTRGRGAFSRAVLGSVSSAVAHHAHCPVAVIHEESLLRPNASQLPVLVGVDSSPNSEDAIAFAFDEASRRQVPLRALYAWSDVSETIAFRLDWGSIETAQHMALAESLAGWQERYPDVKVERIVLRDNPARNLLDHSRDAQLVVVGSHGRGGFAGMLLGSTSSTLLHTVTCPIVIVRPN